MKKIIILMSCALSFYISTALASSDKGCDIRMEHSYSTEPYSYNVYIGKEIFSSHATMDGAISDIKAALSIGQCKKLNSGVCTIHSSGGEYYVKRGNDYLFHYISNSANFGAQYIRIFSQLGICQNKLN